MKKGRELYITDFRIENFIKNTEWNQCPSDIKQRAIRCSIDLMGALILGSQGKQYDSGVRVSKRIGAVGDVPILGKDDRFNLLGASIAFSHAANSFDIDDGYNMVKGHPGASFIGGVLAAALHRNITYREYLETLIVCYETAIRYGLAEQDYYGFLHSTGTYGAFGTAAGIGRIEGLSKEQLNNALSIADYHAPLTPVMRAVEYPSMNKDGVPFGSLIGTMAVLETIEGEVGRTHLLELDKYKDLVDTIGKTYYIRDLYFKPYTCCRWAHQPIKACIDLMNKRKIKAELIKQVRIHTFDAAARLSKMIPHNTDEAQYNIAFPVAAAIVHGDVGFDQINDNAIADEKAVAMMNKLSFCVDPDMEKEFPQKRLAWVELELVDGTIQKSSVYAAPGEHDDPDLSFDWIVKKFRRITAPIINPHEQDKVLAVLSEDSNIKMKDILETVNSSLAAK